MKKTDGISRRGLLKLAAVSGGWLLADKRLFGQTTDESGLARFFTREPGRLRMLAFTDLHLFAGQNQERVNKRTLGDLKAMLKAFDPELFLVNGDNWFEGGPRADEYSKATIEMLSSLGVPWVLVMGNHDVMNDPEKTYRLISEAPNSLFRGGASDGDYRVEILSPGAASVKSRSRGSMRKRIASGRKLRRRLPRSCSRTSRSRNRSKSGKRASAPG